MSWLDIDADGRIDDFHQALVEGEPGTLILLRALSLWHQNTLVDRLRYWSGRRGVPEIRVVELGADEEPIARLEALSLDRGQRTAVVLIGLEQHAASEEGARADPPKAGGAPS